MANSKSIPNEVVTDNYAIYNTDCVPFTESLPSNSVDCVIYSPPFRGLYHYSSDERDMSNCATKDEFFAHYEFLVTQLARITKPGRCNAVHVAEIPDSNNGTDNLEDFPGDVIALHKKLGFRYLGQHVIWKEPLWVRLRTMQKSLQHQAIVEDSMDSGVASADKLLIFAAPGKNQVPVTHPTGLHYYAGATPIPDDVLSFKGHSGKQTENKYSQWIWRQYASSVWDDIRQDRVLPYKGGTDPQDEKHVHPLQRDTIERVVQMRTNPGETVFTPFMGVGSEAYSAVSLGRKALGAELKQSYFKQAIKNMSDCKPVEQSDVKQISLIDSAA